jgi:DNA ligase D-like protein (predicted 3'-phosphoesterase)
MGTHPQFVVQHHLATADHYDFRLEIDNVLVSWAVPKGPSTDPSVRRLAIRSDDHDLAHASVEGTNGRSTVLVWDRGTFRNLSHVGADGIGAGAALARGHLTVWLDGQKLRGGYSLIRTDRRGRETWLLIKKSDEEADPLRDPVASEPESVLSGRTLAEIVEDVDAEGATPS